MEPVPKILIWRPSSTKNDSWSYRCFSNINTQLVSHFSSFKSFWAELRFFVFNVSYTTPKWVLPLELCLWIEHLTLNKVSCHLHHALYHGIRFYTDVFPLLANALESDRGCSLQGWSWCVEVMEASMFMCDWSPAKRRQAPCILFLFLDELILKFGYV